MDQNLDIRAKTTKLLEENRGKLDLGYDFLDMTPTVQATTKEVDKFDYIKFFKLSKDIIDKVKRQPKNEKVFVNHILNEGLISRTYKTLLQLNNNNNKNNPV